MPDGGTTTPGGPQLLTLGVNTTTLTPAGELVFSAVVTHPAGLDAIAGGTLKDPESGGTYGGFGAGTQKGAFEVRLRWYDINAVRPATFDGQTERTFVAEFFDIAGRRATRSAVVTLSCGGPGNWACQGKCTADPNVALDCGARVVYESTTRQACSSLCTNKGLSCTPAACDGYGISAYYQTNLQWLGSCSDVPPATYMSQPFDIQSCCCK
jgi:hypothetical protein